MLCRLRWEDYQPYPENGGQENNGEWYNADLIVEQPMDEGSESPSGTMVAAEEIEGGRSPNSCKMAVENKGVTSPNGRKAATEKDVVGVPHAGMDEGLEETSQESEEKEEQEVRKREREMDICKIQISQVMGGNMNPEKRSYNRKESTKMVKSRTSENPYSKMVYEEDGGAWTKVRKRAKRTRGDGGAKLQVKERGGAKDKPKGAVV